MLCGLFINGPYAVITTAVSNDLVRDLLTIGAHVRQGLQYLVCLSVCLSVCLPVYSHISHNYVANKKYE